MALGLLVRRNGEARLGGTLHYYTNRQSSLRRFLAYDAAEAEFGGVRAWSTSVKSGVRGNKG